MSIRATKNNAITSSNTAINEDTTSHSLLTINNDYHFRIHYNSLSTTWRPKNTLKVTEEKMNHNEKKINDEEWKETFKDFKSTIIKHFVNITQKNFEYFKFQIADGGEITNADDLNIAWFELVNEQDIKIKDIQIANHVYNEIPDDLYTERWMNWERICNGISHEMWPKLANIIRAIIRDKNRNIKEFDISEKCMGDVIDILKDERHLPSEETDYLREALTRATEFDPIAFDDQNMRNMDMSV
eukprot:335131_1